MDSSRCIFVIAQAAVKGCKRGAFIFLLWLALDLQNRVKQFDSTMGCFLLFKHKVHTFLQVPQFVRTQTTC